MEHDTPLSKDESKHQIWNSFFKEYKRYALHTIILKTRSEVKITVTRKWYVTLHHPKMHLHTKFGIPISKNIGGMHQTRGQVQGHRDTIMVRDISSPQDASTHQI